MVSGLLALPPGTTADVAAVRPRGERHGLTGTAGLTRRPTGRPGRYQPTPLGGGSSSALGAGTVRGGFVTCVRGAAISTSRTSAAGAS